MIKSILFDWGGVIAPSAKIVAAQKLSEKYGSDEKKLWTELKSNEIEFLSKKEYDEYFSKLKSKFNIPSEEIEDAINNVPPNKEVMEFIKKLKDGGFKVHLLSDQMKFASDYIRQNYDLDIFDSIYFSNEIGLRKPHKEIFEYVLKNLNQNPSECLLIDDAKINTDSAQEMGFNVILYKDLDQLKSDIKVLVNFK